MITNQDIIYYTKKFDDYVKTHFSQNPTYQNNIQIKIDHSKRVCDYILDIGKSLQFSEEQLNLAHIIALFHDIGRFEQYSKYRTFSDTRSENHAIIGVNELRKHNILDTLKTSDKDFIYRCILYHNKISLPSSETEKGLLFTKLLRDADKLDIYYVVTDYYAHKNEHRNTSIELELPDTDEITYKNYLDVMNERLILIENMKNLNDFKLLQIAWIYDINFKRSFEIIKMKK
ncbi:MAG: HD domain-containing protein, partial [Candidatus Atribacteria bacterium]|nr:HD domain-containing protein [Candidatus Atribacteria bacterium]